MKINWNAFGKIGNEIIEILFRHLLEGTEGNHKILESG
jgi:hypothetical protein